MPEQHTETAPSEEISRRRVQAPDSGQLINILSGPKWIVRAVVWDSEEWSTVPFEVSETLLILRRELGKTSGRRFLFELSKRD